MHTCNAQIPLYEIDSSAYSSIWEKCISSIYWRITQQSLTAFDSCIAISAKLDLSGFQAGNCSKGFYSQLKLLSLVRPTFHPQHVMIWQWQFSSPWRECQFKEQLRPLLWAGNVEATAVVQRLLRAASRPYFEMLEYWLCQGALNDPYAEFMVEEDKVLAIKSPPQHSIRVFALMMKAPLRLAR